MSRALTHRQLVWVIAVIGLSTIADARADNWPQWRGPKNNGISAEKNLPTEWNDQLNVLWKLPLPGPAGATPVVWGDHVFLTSAVDGGELYLLCIGTDGKERWRKKIGGGDKAVRGDEGNSASPSPVTDGKHVWTFMGNGELACYDFAGNEKWHYNVESRYKKLNIAFGMTSTPVLDDGRLYLQLLHTNEALVVCIDGATGNEIWKRTRPSDARAECLHSYASPVMYDDGQRKFLLSHGCDYIIAHDLKDGAELWRCGGLNPLNKYNATLRLVASPSFAPGLIVVPSAKNGPVLGLRPDGTGDITTNQSAHVWTRKENTPDVPSPVIHDGLVYLCRENGVLICMDANSGEEIYQERCYSDRYRASPVVADGKVYLASRKGVITVVKAGRKFEKLAENDMKDAVSSSLAFAGGRIYIRAFGTLFCISDKTTAAVDAKAEPAQVGTSIFNGRDMTGWVVEGTKDYKDGSETKPVWTVADGKILCAGKGYGFLRFDRSVSDFAFRVEFKMNAKCNSGIGIRGTAFTGPKETRPSFHGYEVQLLDDGGKPPTDHSTGSLYRYVAAKADAMKPAGEWNVMEIKCVGPRITITLNGTLLQDVDQTTVPAIKDKPLSGYVSLQNHGGAIEFRNVTLQELTKSTASAK